MFKLLLALSVFASALTAGADTPPTELKLKKLPSYYQECREAGLAKVREQATAYGYQLDESTFILTGLDDRFFNPYKYMWWSGLGRNDSGQTQWITKLTQKSYAPLKKCF
ncbi:MAG: hypothetical protein ABL958_16675 [Bdellovibrionia bacterium]